MSTIRAISKPFDSTCLHSFLVDVEVVTVVVVVVVVSVDVVVEIVVAVVVSSSIVLEPLDIIVEPFYKRRMYLSLKQQFTSKRKFMRNFDCLFIDSCSSKWGG